MVTSRKDILVILTVAVVLPFHVALAAPSSSASTGTPLSVEGPTKTTTPLAPIIGTVPTPLQIAQADEAAGTEEDDGQEAGETGNAPEEKMVAPPPPPAEAKEGAPARPARVQGVPPAPVQPGGPPYVSLNFDNADLELVLRSIADITGINFIIGPGVKANVTMRTTTRVPSTEVFSIMESVLEVNNLAAVKEGSYYKIVPVAVAQQEPQDVQMGKERVEERERYVTQIVQLEYLSADETSKILQSLVGKGAKMIVHKETNSLIIAGFTSTLKRMLETIKALDVPTKRDNIQRIFVYFVENAKAAELANTLNTLYGRRDLVRGATPVARPGQPGIGPATGAPIPPTPVSGQPPSPTPGQPASPSGTALPPGAEAAHGEVVGDVTIVSDEATNTLIIKTSPRNYEFVEATIKKLDIIPKQVLIELLLAQITLNDSFNFSLEQVLRSGTIMLSSLNGGAAAAAVNAFKNPSTTLPPTGFTFTTFVDKEQFRLVLNNLAQVTKVEVLANPHLLTANNKEANIQIGSEVPIPTGVQSLSTGSTGNLFSTFQRKDIGIILKIKPHVNEKRLVALDIETENTSIAGNVPDASQGGATFNKTTTKTALVVQDDQSLVIGGMIRTDKSKGYSGIPFLSRIPLIGYLFRNTSDALTRTELVLLITPHVVASPEEGHALTERFRTRVESLELLMKSSPTTSPSGLAPKLSDDK